MACRAFRKTLTGRGSLFKTPTYVHQGKGGVLACNDSLGDSTLGLPMFVQKHDPHFLHRRDVAQVSHSLPQSHSSPLHAYRLGNRPSDNLVKDRLSLPHVQPPVKYQISTEERAKILRFVQLEGMKRKLRGIPDACISYNRLLELCKDCGDDSSEDEGRDTVRLLEESGSIIIIGRTVYLHPEQIARALESVLPLFANDSCREELQKLEKEKAEIDMESERLVRNEFWCGLGLLSLQTVAIFRLTFWELSWDIMEPICFFLTSVYCLLAYAFFLRTSKEPTFEGFFAARFKIKQKKVIKKRNFNIERYRELQRMYKPEFDTRV